MTTEDPSIGTESVGGGSVAGCLAEKPMSRKNDAGGARTSERHFATAHLMTNLRGRTVSSGFVTVASQGIQFVLTIASTMVLARLLLPEDFGLVAMVTAVIGFLRVFKDAGLSTATIQREGITHAQVSNLFWINVGLSAVVSLLLMACAPVVAWFYREPRLVGITVALAGTFLLTGATVQHMALLCRQMRFKVIAAIQVTSLAVGIAVGVAMAIANCGYWSLVAFQLASPFATLIFSWSASRWRPQLPARRAGTRPLLNFGANLAAGGFLWSFARGTDGLIIGRWCGAASIGLYSRASALLMRPLEQAMSPFESVFVPTLCRLQDNPARYRRTFLAIYEAIALAGFLFGGLLFALAHSVTLIVLGAKWEKAATIFAAFSVSLLFYPLTTVTSWLFSSQGRGKDWLLTTTILSVMTICSFVAGLPYGPAGVAITFSLAGVLVLLPVMFYLAGRSGPIKTSQLWAGFFKHLPVWFLTSGSIFIMRRLVGDLSPIGEGLVFGTLGLIAGTLFVAVYSPSRAVAVNVLSTIIEARRKRISVSQQRLTR